VSLDAQRARVKAYAELYDLELAEVVVDAGESAKHLDRPGLQRALGMLKRGEAGSSKSVGDRPLVTRGRDLWCQAWRAARVARAVCHASGTVTSRCYGAAASPACSLAQGPPMDALATARIRAPEARSPARAVQDRLTMVSMGR